MHAQARTVIAPEGRYRVGGVLLDPATAAFSRAVEHARDQGLRPRCMCRAEGVEMYIARLPDALIVKRMPDTGHLHAAACPSFDPPDDASGLGPLRGTAILEDPMTGTTALKLAFPMSQLAGRSGLPVPQSIDSCVGSVTSSGRRLSLRGLLHYLWDQSGLTRWHPGFEGKRNWARVRRMLYSAAEHKIAGGRPLRSMLYVPETFSVGEREEISARRATRWARAVGRPGQPQQLVLLIGALKEIEPTRHGFRAIVKHLPDQAFLLDDALYRRLGRHFENELALWAACDNVNMIAAATFAVSTAGLPSIIELSLMPVTPAWIPVADGFELQLIDRLVADGRAFIKGMRYDLDSRRLVASAVLTDCGPMPTNLLIAPLPLPMDVSAQAVDATTSQIWRWDPCGESMPLFPAPRRS